MRRLPGVSVVLATRDRPDLLVAAVASIVEGTVRPEEIVVVDQSARPHPVLGRPEGAGGGTIRYLWSTEVGLSRANNVGAAAARGDVLVYTHDDVLVARTWLAEIVSALHRAGARSVVTGRVLPTDPERPGGFTLTQVVSESGRVYQGRIGHDVLYPLNMAMHRAALRDVGGFDERIGPGTRFPAAEDNDLGFRLLEAGYRIVYVPEAVVLHRSWRDPGTEIPLGWRYGLGQGAYYAKHLRLRDAHMLGRLLGEVGGRLARGIWRLPASPRRGLRQIAQAIAIVVGASEWLLERAWEGHA